MQQNVFGQAMYPLKKLIPTLNVWNITYLIKKGNAMNKLMKKKTHLN